MAMFLQLILFNPRLLQYVGYYNYRLGCYLFFNLDRQRAYRAIESAEVFGEDIFNIFFSIISFLKTNVTRCNLISHSALFAFYEK